MKTSPRTVSISFATINSPADRTFFDHLCSEPSNDRHGIHLSSSTKSATRVELSRNVCVSYQARRAVRTTTKVKAIIRLKPVKSADVTICCSHSMGKKLYSLKQDAKGRFTLFLNAGGKPLDAMVLKQITDCMLAQAYAAAWKQKVRAS